MSAGTKSPRRRTNRKGAATVDAAAIVPITPGLGESMFAGDALDRLAIRELIDGQCDAVMRFDPDRWAAAWVEESVYELAGYTFTGRQAIVEGWLGLMNNIKAIALSAFPGAIEIDGDHASVVTHTIEHVTYKDGSVRMLSGMYYDELFREDRAQWRFKRRDFRLRALEMPVPAPRPTDADPVNAN